MKQKSPKEMMLEAFQKHGANPDNMTCNYMPDAIPNVTVWMKTSASPSFPDTSKTFSATKDKR